jgi:tetratricopeptide (TPR) repeat protein
MARVYVSSTKLDLEQEREAVIHWLVQAEHQPRHSYVADDETVRASCLSDVLDSEAYVLILGHRYGYIPADENPHARSITELEYNCAIGAKIPCIVLIAQSISDVALTDIQNQALYAKVQAFRALVESAHRPALYHDKAELIAALAAGLQRALAANPLADPKVQRIIVQLNADRSDRDDTIQRLRRENERLKAELAAAIARTLQAAAEPDATPSQVAAAAALERGDAAPAAALLGEEAAAAASRADAETDPAIEQAERRRAATLARERGALATGSDVQTALAAYREASKYSPTDRSTWILLGDIQVAAGDLSSATESYGQAHALSQRALKVSVDDVDARRDLSVSHERIGTVHVAKGELGEALQAFDAGLLIDQQLAARDPANPLWQRYLCVSNLKIGDVRLEHGDREQALQAFTAALAIAKRLADRDPANTQWQRDLSVSYERIGDVHVVDGDREQAQAAFETSLAIRSQLAARDSANTLWQRDLSVSYNKIGDFHAVQGDLEAAQRTFEASHTIRTRLAVGDPANAQWQIDVAVSHSKLASLATKPVEERRELLTRGLAILEQLTTAGRLPPNQDWRAEFREGIAGLGGPD